MIQYGSCDLHGRVGPKSSRLQLAPRAPEPLPELEGVQVDCAWFQKPDGPWTVLVQFPLTGGGDQLCTRKLGDVYNMWAKMKTDLTGIPMATGTIERNDIDGSCRAVFTAAHPDILHRGLRCQLGDEFHDFQKRCVRVSACNFFSTTLLTRKSANGQRISLTRIFLRVTDKDRPYRTPSISPCKRIDTLLKLSQSVALYSCRYSSKALMSSTDPVDFRPPMVSSSVRIEITGIPCSFLI